MYAYPSPSPPQPSADVYGGARNYSASPHSHGAATTTTTSYARPSSPVAGAHFNHHFETVARALDSFGVPGIAGYGQTPASPRQESVWGASAAAPPVTSPLGSAPGHAYSKTVSVAPPGGAPVEHFRIAVGESGDNIRETIRSAFGLSAATTFTLRDQQGLNAVLGFPSLTDGSQYQLRITQAGGLAAGAPAEAGGGFAASMMAPAAASASMVSAPPAAASMVSAPPPVAAMAASTMAVHGSGVPDMMAASASDVVTAAGDMFGASLSVRPPPSVDVASSSARPPHPATRRPSTRREVLPPPSSEPGPLHGRYGRHLPIPGATKALLIGINYRGQSQELSGCVNDVQRTVGFLDDAGFGGTRWVLTDDDPHQMPTKENILRGLSWLTEDAKAGDSLLVYFSGHGAEFRDDDDPEGGFEEAILPVDFKEKDQGGYRIIRSEEVHDLLVSKVPAGANCTIICDCCHSGTMVALPHSTVVHKAGHAMCTTDYGEHGARVCMISTCKDERTSPELAGNGAFTAAVCSALLRDSNPALGNLLVRVRDELRQRLGEQCPVPRFSSTHPFDLTDRFFLGGGQ